MNAKLVSDTSALLNLIIALIILFIPGESYSDVKPAHDLCPAWIEKVPVEREYAEPAAKYGICAQLFKALLGVESNWNHTALNPLTLDYGIGQINYRTARALGLDLGLLRANRAYSIDKAALVLKYHKKLYKNRLGPINWVCSYNQGHTLDHKLCSTYIAKIKRFNY